MADVKRLAAELRNLSLPEALEVRAAIEQRIAALALKSLGESSLNTLDDSSNLSSAGSLADKASML
jgi:DNA-binding FadR family transcriptional regulator